MSADFNARVREQVNATILAGGHHPVEAGRYTPGAFRHYIRARALLDALSRLEFESVLDVGCAEGFFMDVVRRRFPRAEVWGIDISDLAVTRARDRLALPVAAGDALQLPLPDGSFDLVISTEVVEHVLDPARMLAELRRVARRWVVVTTPVSQGDGQPDFELRHEGHISSFDTEAVERVFGADAHVQSFRCNLTVGILKGLGRFLPRRARDPLYELDYRVSRRFGSPHHGSRLLRNRDWLIVVAASEGETSTPAWCCPLCRGELTARGDGLRCERDATVYPFLAPGAVPDFLAREKDERPPGGGRSSNG